MVYYFIGLCFLVQNRSLDPKYMEFMMAPLLSRQPLVTTSDGPFSCHLEYRSHLRPPCRPFYFPVGKSFHLGNVLLINGFLADLQMFVAYK